jgi:hypothetical protein
MNKLFAILLMQLSIVSPAWGTEATITYQVDAWPYQSGLVVKNMRVEVGTPHLNLLNHSATATIRISGTASLKGGGWRPEVLRAHVSERLVPTATDPNRFVEIEVTPIVDVTEDTSYNGMDLPYALSFDYTLHTYDWGINHFRVVVLGKEQRFDLQQSK